jgi:DNA polymerase elongation subunit (family B)
MSDLFFFKDDQLIYRAKEKPWQATKAPKFQDRFELAYSNVAPDEMRDDELPAIVGTVMFYDVECFVNYFMVAFRSLTTGKVVILEQDETALLNAGKLRWLLNNFCIIGYNSINYDILLLELAMTGASCERLFEASCDIIQRDMRPHDFEKKYKVKRQKYNHVDLIEVAPLRGSLKLYAGRLHSARMQDLPVDPLAGLTPEEIADTRAYCLNDLVNTELLFKELEQPLVLRSEMSVQYGIDLRSKSDAQISEAVIESELKRLNGFKVDRPQVDEGRSYQYRVPNFISYRTPALQNMLEIVKRAQFSIDGLGYIIMPYEIEQLELPIGQCVYKMGIGGLHSTEKTIAHEADEDTLLLDRDVASYYPSIILNQKLAPKHLGSAWLTVYKTLVDSRLADKKSGNKVGANSKKIVINGSFGKLGSKWSVLYAPDLMIQVTISGQLCLLLLIEMIEDLGIPVISANTDGVLIKCPKARAGELQERIEWWEKLTGFQTEETRYKAVYARDVNNYIAVKEKVGDADAKFLDERLGVKVKGCYGERGSAGDSVLAKNPETLICNDAVMELLRNGKPLEETIRACKDIRRFVAIRNVTGGARKSDAYLGKVIRWYYSTEMKGEINRALKGDKVPKSDRARPLMELPAEFPSDVDYDRYIETATSMLHDIGYFVGAYKASTGELGPLFK